MCVCVCVFFFLNVMTQQILNKELDLVFRSTCNIIRDVLNKHGSLSYKWFEKLLQLYI